MPISVESPFPETEGEIDKLYSDATNVYRTVKIPNKELCPRLAEAVRVMHSLLNIKL